MAATNRARHPSRSSEQPCHGLSPWRLGRPRRTLVPKRVQWLITDPWLPTWRLQSIDGSRCGRSALLQTGDGGTPSHSDPSAVTPVALPGLVGHRRYLCEAAIPIKWFALLHPVLLIGNRHHTVVRVQVNSDVFHLDLLWLKASSQTHFTSATNLSSGWPAR